MKLAAANAWGLTTKRLRTTLLILSIAAFVGGVALFGVALRAERLDQAMVARESLFLDDDLHWTWFDEWLVRRVWRYESLSSRPPYGDEVHQLSYRLMGVSGLLAICSWIALAAYLAVSATAKRRTTVMT